MSTKRTSEVDVLVATLADEDAFDRCLALDLDTYLDGRREGEGE